MCMSSYTCNYIIKVIPYIIKSVNNFKKFRSFFDKTCEHSRFLQSHYKGFKEILEILPDIGYHDLSENILVHYN